MKLLHRPILAFALCLTFAGAFAAPLGASPAPRAVPAARVVLAGGCFWGMQAVFQSLRGVQKVVAGYSGGAASTAHYEMVSTGTTGHAESVEITYDPAAISFQQLLEVFFLVAHDPTQVGHQGPDWGSQYRSEIFYTTTAQRDAAIAYIQRLQRKHVFPAPIVTTVVPLQAFYPAEAYHQNFVAKNPDNPYVVVNDLPKLAALRARFPQLVSKN